MLVPNRMKLGGTAMVVCVHQVEKNVITDIEYDRFTEKVQQCLCCNNLFKTRSDTPRFCDPCGGHPVLDRMKESR